MLEDEIYNRRIIESALENIVWRLTKSMENKNDFINCLEQWVHLADELNEMDREILALK